MKALATALLLCAAAHAQPLTIGFLAGLPLAGVTGDNTGYVHSYGRKYVAGAAVGVRLPHHLSIEADALYREYSVTAVYNGYSGYEWRFPVLLQYRFGNGRIRPIIESGISVDHYSSLPVATQFTLNNPLDGTPITGYRFPFGPINRTGAVFGAGLEIKAWRSHTVSAELRYTRSGSEPANPNTADLLFGFHF